MGTTIHGRGRSRAAGRDVSRLLADFGHDLPTIPAAVRPQREERLFRQGSWRGTWRAGRGWVAATAPVASWRMTSDQAPALWPWISTPGLPPTGAQMGIDMLSGSAFYSDPLGWVLRDDIPVTNPNIMQFGKPGTGKSGTAKAFCLRMMDFGYRTLVLGDTKDEYEALCRFLGHDPIVLGPGMGTRVNPLAIGPLAQGWEDLPAAEASSRSQVVFGCCIDPLNLSNIRVCA